MARTNLTPLHHPESSAAKTFRSIWGVALVILAALSTGAGYAAKALHLLDKKADVAVVRTDEDRLGALVQHVAAHDAATDARLDNLDRGVSWMMQTTYAQAKANGLNPAPIPTPRAVPDPFASPSSP